MGEILNEFDFNEKIRNFEVNFNKSKKYCILYTILVLIGFLCQLNLSNYFHPAEEIFIFILISILGIFCITYYVGHNNDKELYKTAFIIILSFGIIFCLLSTILCTPDEVEHFVRSEITSNGVFVPQYSNGSFLTIQSTLDLIEKSKHTWDSGFDSVDMASASIFRTSADTQPINYTLVKYPSAFAQNPFYGYLPQAIGIAIAKLFNLNAIWLVWLGRIFNIIMYSTLASVAVKKSPILKIPIIAFACLPLAMFTSASLSIDAMICGLSLLTVSYFFYMYKSPKGKLNRNNIFKFSLLVVLLGLCKVTCFAFILLLFAIPRENFKDGVYRINTITALIAVVCIALLWTKFYANPGVYLSFRAKHYATTNINASMQINYMINHLNHGIVSILRYPRYLGYLYNLCHSMLFNQLYLMFMGAICLLYPHEKFNRKSRIVAMLVVSIFFFGTIFTFLLSWTPVGDLYTILGLQTRYLIPVFTLLPFIFGINYVEINKDVIDRYTIVLALCFLAFEIAYIVAVAY